jgi:phosphatidylglycerol:prolipoprotein diacylglycerol transferase
MLAHPEIDPVAFSLGPLRVHWYGLMYLFGFSAAWWLGRLRARQSWRGWHGRDMDDVLFYAALGVVLGGRIGYVLFYDFARFSADPLSIVKVWQGGMSFHGGLLGVLVAMALFARSRGFSFFKVADFVAPLVPPGLLAGRLGNFINGHLWGRPTDLPWGMVFPSAEAGGVPRHPSQLYEAALEGALLFALLWWFSARPRRERAASGLFLVGYGAARCLVELVREPDQHLGYLAFGWFTMGQALSLPMVLAGIALLAWSRSAPLPQDVAQDGADEMQGGADATGGGRASAGRRRGRRARRR